MNAQLSLKFSSREPKTNGAEKAVLIDTLQGRDWVSANELQASLGWNPRKIRSVASSSPEIVSFGGSQGYKLMSECTLEEYHHFRNANRSAARELIARVVRADRQWFARTGVSV